MSSWNPTHVVVAVQRAKDLISKGKNGTNDAFVTIALADKKFQTSVKDKVIDPEWYEECDVPLPDNYNDHKLILQVFHRNNLGIDEFLGHLEVPLQNFDVYDPPKPIWYSLLCKPGQNKSKPRGELEVRMSFEVKKVKDFDEMSTTSSASRRFKMSKKNIKHAASAIGRKIKGPKPEKTSDYIHVPDLTGLDSGALSMDDIAENYASPVNVSKKRLSNTSDSLSLPPSSPAFQRSSPRSSRGYSPFNRRRSKGEKDTPPSSNASMEDVKQRADDTDNMDNLFTKTHKRGGSGSDMMSAKPNRRLLTSRPKSSSTLDISSAAGSEFDVIADCNVSTPADDLAGKSRIRTATSASQLSTEVLPEVEEDSKEGKSPASRPAPAVVDEPVLVDDESDDSLAEYTPSPITPVFKKSEPTDLFARVAAQMEQEQVDDFPVVKHHAEPGEQIFSSVGDLSKPDATTAHSTPIAEESSLPAIAKHKKKKGKSKDKVVTPASDLFNLLMASDEPEYAVDDTLPANSKLIPPVDDTKPSHSNGRTDVDTEAMNVLQESKVQVDESLDNVVRGEPVEKETQKEAVEVTADEVKRAADCNPFDEPVVVVEEPNPEVKKSVPSSVAPFVTTTDTSNVFDVKARSSSNPFADTSTQSSAANTSVNPFDDAIKQPSADDTSVNPFEGGVDEKSTNPFDEPPSAASGNPFEDVSPPVSSKNPFESTESTANESKNPFDDADDKSNTNPFEDDEEDDDQTSSFNRAGSFARKGSSRFTGAKRGKKKGPKKVPAPPPPKPQRTFTENDTEEPSTDTSTTASAPTTTTTAVAVDSPRHKFKKVKKAPPAPSNISSPSAAENSRGRSSSFDPTFSVSTAEKRRDTDSGRMESVIAGVEGRRHSGSKAPSSDNLLLQGKYERQPAVGAEAPDIPDEPRVTCDIGVQVSINAQDARLAPEFRNKSKQELVDIIGKLRVQVRKGEDHAKDLEEYIDSLLLRVMTTDPNLLITQTSCAKQAHQVHRLS